MSDLAMMRQLKWGNLYRTQLRLGCDSGRIDAGFLTRVMSRSGQPGYCARDPPGATLCAFLLSDSIGMEGKHIGPVIVACHIQVELAPRDIVQIQVRS